MPSTLTGNEGLAPSEKLILLGIHGFHIHPILFDTESKSVRRGKAFTTSEDPSWLTRHPTLPDIVYANGHVDGKAFALRLTDAEGGLEVLSEAKTGGAGPTHIAVHPEAGIVLAHYKTGNTSTIPLAPSGALAASSPSSSFAPPAISLAHEHPRQEMPHAHQVALHPQSGDVFVPDLGSNKVWRLRWDGGRGELVEVDGGSLVGFEKGDGPRHMVFHPDGEHAYTLCELSSTLVTHSLSRPTSPLSRHSILPPRDTELSNGPSMLASEIVLIPPLTPGADMLLIASNRDSPNPEGDALALFAVGAADGSQVTRAPTPYLVGLGKHLRGVAADRTSRWVVVCARNGGGVMVFERLGEGLEMKEVARVDIDKTVCPLWMD